MAKSRKKWLSLFFVIFFAGTVSFFTFSCSREKGAAPRNLLIITVDTLRADHVGCYGYSKKTTPNIDALADRGVLFLNAACQAPITLPSHASIFTGTLPIYHRLRVNAENYLPDEQTTLAELLKEKGYATAAFVSALVLDSKYGLDQGFDTYDADFAGSVLSQIKWTAGRKPEEKQPEEEANEQKVCGSFERRADETTQAAVRWINQNRQRKFFLWVHYFDPHFPYYKYDETGEKVIDQEGVNVTTGLIYYGNVDKAIRYYDGEIMLTDLWIGRLLDTLSDLGLVEDTLIVLTADHGEGLGEKNYYYEHEDHLYENLIHVPLIFVYPKKLPKGLRVAERVCSIDIVPTICEFMNVPVPPAVQGFSLMPLCLSKPGWKPIGVLSETMAPMKRGESGLYAFIRDDWKMVWAPQGNAFGLYNLQQDPHEEKNLCDYADSNEKLFVEKYLTVFRGLNAELQDTLRTKAGKEITTRAEMDEKTRHMLKSLGYLD
jgi:arylsulfatase A-like enzyme